MNTAEFLNELRSQDVRIEVIGDRLRFDAPAGVLTAGLRSQLAGRKQEILTFLSNVSALASQQPAVVPLNAYGDRTPIFAVPGHNGDVFCFRALAALLGKERPFYGLQPPGFDGLSSPMTSVAELAGYYTQQIQATRPAGELMIVGFCAGGGIALELACRLQEGGRRVSMLMLFASPFPKAYRFWSMVRIRLGNVLERVRVHARELLARNPAGMIRYAVERIRAVTSAGTRRHEQAGRVRADPLDAKRKELEETTLRALVAYEPRRFTGRGVLFLPSTQWRRIGDNSRGWQTVVGEYSEIVGLEGCTGDNILLEPHVRHTATELKRLLPD